MPQQTKTRGRKVVAVREASSVLKELSQTKPELKPRFYRVTFRSLDGSVGRRDFATHCIHRYPAKMFHRIPRAILQSLRQSEPLVILDPFCGSGTVMLEAILGGHSSIGVDVNPLARLITSVKTTPITPAHLSKHTAGIIRRARKSVHVFKQNAAFEYWFKPDVRITLEKLAASISCLKHPQCRAFFEVTLSNIVRRSSLADPSIPPPVKLNQKRAHRANRKYRNDLKRALRLSPDDVFSLFQEAVRRNLSRMKELVQLCGLGTATVLPSYTEARRTGLPDNSIDLVMTSPPYCGAQKYARSLRLEMLLLGVSENEIAEVDRLTLGTERVATSKHMKIAMTRFAFANRLLRKIFARNPIRAAMLTRYVNYLDDFALELKRVMKPGANAFVTFGTVRLARIDVQSAGIFARIATHHGLRHIATLIDSIPSRGLMTIRHSTAGTINDECVVWLKSQG